MANIIEEDSLESWQQDIGMSEVSLSSDSLALELKEVSKNDFVVSQDCSCSIEQSAGTHIGIASTLFYFQKIIV